MTAAPGWVVIHVLTGSRLPRRPRSPHTQLAILAISACRSHLQCILPYSYHPPDLAHAGPVPFPDSSLGECDGLFSPCGFVGEGAAGAVPSDVLLGPGAKSGRIPA